MEVDQLCALADELRARGVVRATVGDVTLEMLPAAVMQELQRAELARQRAGEARKHEATRIEQQAESDRADVPAWKLEAIASAS